MGEEAAHLAADFELPLAAMYGPQHEDVCLLSNAKVQRQCAVSCQQRVVSCTFCHKLLVDSRLSSDDTSTDGVGALDVQLPNASWCSRCHLAPFCCLSCEDQAKATHSLFCVTSEGRAA